MSSGALYFIANGNATRYSFIKITFHIEKTVFEGELLTMILKN